MLMSARARAVHRTVLLDLLKFEAEGELDAVRHLRSPNIDKPMAAWAKDQDEKPPAVFRHLRNSYYTTRNLRTGTGLNEPHALRRDGHVVPRGVVDRHHDRPHEVAPRELRRQVEVRRVPARRQRVLSS